MSAIVSAQGFTSLYMVMNLSRFVAEEDRDFFHALRGTVQYREVLENQVSSRLLASPWFRPLKGGSIRQSPSGGMSVTEAGFATGIFRQNLLEKYIGPVYRFDKDAYWPEIHPSVRNNLQFKKIFLPMWEKWDIYVRPSVFGAVVIQLVRQYERATPLEQIASDVARLQSPFDIASARHFLEGVRTTLADDQARLKEKEKSIQELLNWLGDSDSQLPQTPDYSPAQWQLAMEVTRAFSGAIDGKLDVDGHNITLVQPPKELAHPLHDSYVIHHIDHLTANPLALPSYRQQIEKKGQKWYQQPRLTVQVTLDDLFGSDIVRQKVLNLLEGSLLSSAGKPAPEFGVPSGSGRFFPKLKGEILDEVRRLNLATWDDELCIMNSRTAVIIPSTRAREYDLFISTLPSSIATSRVNYLQYWDAIEFMVGFVAEIRVLAQLIEHASSDLLQHCVEVLRQKRQGIIAKNVMELLEEFNYIIAQTANLSRLLAIAQTLNNPATWGRVEFSITKAQYLLSECAIPQSLAHASENIANLNALVEHLDELFLTDSAERREKINFLSSLAITGLSLVLTVLMLPSFWADLNYLDSSLSPLAFVKNNLTQINGIGSGLALILVVISPVVFLISVASLFKTFWRQRKSHRNLS